MMMAAAMQQRMLEKQMMRAQQVAAERQAKLVKRQYNAERTRAETAARRERIRQFIAAQNGDPVAADKYRLLAANQPSRR
jgi:hypothetical protein